MKKLLMLLLTILLISPALNAQAAPILAYNQAPTTVGLTTTFEYEGYAPDDDGEGLYYRHATAAFTPNATDGNLEIVLTNLAPHSANPNQLLAGIFFDYSAGLGDPINVSLTSGSFLSDGSSVNLSEEYGYRTDADTAPGDVMPQYFISGSSYDPLGVNLVSTGEPGTAQGKDYMMGNLTLGNSLSKVPIVVNSVTIMWDLLERQYGDVYVPAIGAVSNVYFAYGTSYDSAPVPEPATLLLFGTGLIGLAGFGRKKLKKQS